MKNKTTLSSVWKDAKMKAAAVAVAVGYKAIAPQLDFDAVKEAFIEFVRAPDAQEMVENAHPDFRKAVEDNKNAEMYVRKTAMSAADNLLNDHQEMLEFRTENGYTEDDCRDCGLTPDGIPLTEDGLKDKFLRERGYTHEQCKICEFLESDDVNLLMNIGRDFYVQKFDFNPADFALAVPDHESGFEFPLESKTGDLGLWGINKGRIGGLKEAGGLDEVYLIFNPEKNPEKHPNKWHRLYREAFPHVIARYGRLMRGSEEEVLERVHESKKANTVAAYTHISYLVFKYGPKNFLEYYNEGEGNGSPGYNESVLAKKEEWDNNIELCKGMKAEYRDFRRDEKEFCNVMNSRFNTYKNNFEKRMKTGKVYNQWKNR